MPRILKWLGFALGLFVLMLFFPDVLLVPFTLLLGWVSFLRRILPEFRPGAATLTLVFVSLILLLAGTQWFLTWVYGRVRTPGGGAVTAVRRWPWRWTLALHAGLWLALLAVISMVCIIHQVGWMYASKQPVFVSKMWPARATADLVKTARALRAAGEANNWDPAKMQTAIWEGRFESAETRGALWENHHVVFLPGSDGRLAAAVVLPRDPKARSKLGLALVEPGAEINRQSADALPRILARSPLPAPSLPLNRKESP